MIKILHNLMDTWDAFPISTWSTLSLGWRSINNLLIPSQLANYKSTCEILNREENVKQSNNYTLDFDGPGPIKPAKVYCNMTADPPTTRVLTRDIGIRLVPSDVAKTPNSQRIRYIPSLAAAKALARQSGRCTQYLEFGCKQAKLLNVGGERLGFWVSADGVYQDYWGGAQPNSKSCACGETNTCLDKNFKCNCDAARNVWTADGGHLNSTTLLPVEEVMFKGVVKPGEANYTVGSLYCSGKLLPASFVVYPSMARQVGQIKVLHLKSDEVHL